MKNVKKQQKEAIKLQIFNFSLVFHFSARIQQNGKDCTNHKCHPFTECHLSKTEDDRIIPVCIKVPSCATKQCDFGEKCLMKPVKCQLTPCFKVPICLPDVNEASPEYQMPPALLV
ncbi:hypothetical protein CAEBREN_04530 [Caenorhabditis brenneri]|uniref:Uncharacterized protein n=1 Tax=Caenorhabditis brenneri TaxID=135651 RepID=G0NU20_CAEBE|nr:hypothetical protein CAEBREN_04530 [Caenorhabditis brenneri]